MTIVQSSNGTIYPAACYKNTRIIAINHVENRRRYILLLIIQSNHTMATEKQAYRVVHAEDEFEIRYYPSAILATVHSNAHSYRELAYPGFRQLAGYIFGGNETGSRISMTSPDHMDINDSLSSMSLAMPSFYEMGKLPAPDKTK